MQINYAKYTNYTTLHYTTLYTLIAFNYTTLHQLHYSNNYNNNNNYYYYY